MDGHDRGHGGGKILKATACYHKLVDVVLCLLHAAGRQRFAVTQSDLAEATFIADESLLNRFGFPLTYDAYYATENGPVPMSLCGLLEDDPEVVARTGPVQWKRRPALGGDGQFEYFAPARPVDEDLLDDVDVSELEAALMKVKALSASERKRRTRGHPAYEAAWIEGSQRKAFLMDYALMFNPPDAAQAADLADISRNFVI